MFCFRLVLDLAFAAGYLGLLNLAGPAEFREWLTMAAQIIIVIRHFKVANVSRQAHDMIHIAVLPSIRNDCNSIFVSCSRVQNISEWRPYTVEGCCLRFCRICMTSCFHTCPIVVEVCFCLTSPRLPLKNKGKRH